MTDYRAIAMAWVAEPDHRPAVEAAARHLHANESLHLHDNTEGTEPCSYCWLRAAKAVQAIERSNQRIAPQVNPDQMTELEELVAALPDSPWLMVDRRYTVQLWLESSLLDVTRNKDGEITGYRTPNPYLSSDIVAEWDDDEDDQQIRAVARFMEAARTAVPALLAEVEHLQAKLAKDHDELRDKRTDLLNVRGILKPADQPEPVVPMPLGKDVAPAVEWLAAEVKRLAGEKTTALDHVRQLCDQRDHVARSVREFDVRGHDQCVGQLLDDIRESFAIVDGQRDTEGGDGQ